MREDRKRNKSKRDRQPSVVSGGAEPSEEVRAARDTGEEVRAIEQEPGEALRQGDPETIILIVVIRRAAH
jgi:hypothetical protein